MDFRFAVVSLALLITPAPALALQDEALVGPAGLLPPSDILDSLSRQIRQGQAAAAERGETHDQLSLVYPFIQLVEIDENNPPDDPVQALATGDILFLRFAPARADRFYTLLLDRDDWIGRHAWRRHMQMEFRARGNHDAVRQMVDDYAERFPPTPLDIRDLAQQQGNIAALDFSEGRADDAVDRIMAELTRLPADAPYTAYFMPLRFSDEIAASGRREEVRDLVAARLGDLREAQAALEASVVLAADDPILTAGRPSWYWTFQDVASGDTFKSAHLAAYRQLIAALAAWSQAE